MRITSLKCAVLGGNPVGHVVADEGIGGYGETESAKPCPNPVVLRYKPYLLGQDRANAGRVPFGIRVACVKEMREMLGDRVGLPLGCGPG